MVVRFAHFLLVAALALAMVGASVSHGLVHAVLPAAGPYQQVVICAGGTERVVLLDARGNPVGTDAPCPEPLCPDCLTVTSGALPVNGALTCPTSPPRPAVAPRAGIVPAICRPAHEAARGPPHKV